MLVAVLRFGTELSPYGKSLRYRKLKPGFVVCSINEDLSDNGGAERNTKKRDQRGKPLSWDITFIVER